jgi:superfamily II DNA or RNA helicase
VHTTVPVPGTVVWIRAMRWRVERARLDRDVVRLDVAARNRRLTYLAPFDRPVPVGRRRRPMRVRVAQALARVCSSIAASCGARSIASVTGARIEILPHQLEPVLALLAGSRRILIADEVGLGKTVQAGLAIAEVVRRRAAGRVLVVVPAALRDQWTEELRTRFSIEAIAADRTSFERLGRAGLRGEDPWRRSGVWIATPDYLKQPHVVGALPMVPWDLVVIDEAHDVCGLSDRHDACDEVARRSRRVLLLTATPHSGDAARFDRLCRLGVLDGINDDVAVFRRTRATIGARPQRHLRWHGVGLAPAESRLLDALAIFERVVLERAPENQHDVACLLLSVFRKRALSTTAALVRSLDRRLSWLEDPVQVADVDWHQPAFDFGDDRDQIGEDERFGLYADTGLARGQELAWLRRLRTLATAASRHESKVTRLAALARRTIDPLIVFTEFRDSLECVKRRLETTRGVAAIHGGQSHGERRRELDRFTCGGATVLVATDVAGQGLNLQARARWVASLELPWNPARLEQRIGRVDRIGQRRIVHATILVARHPAEHGLLARMARRALTAKQALGENVLPVASPSVAALVPALAAGAMDIEPAPASRTVQLCARWVRPATMAARVARRQRALAARWRAPSPHAASAVWSRLRTSQLLAQGARGAILVFSVPLVDGTGFVVERRSVAIRVAAAPAAMCPCRVLIDAAGLVAGRRLDRRAERLRRERARTLARDLEIEEALARYLGAIARPEEAEPGLFDRAVERACEAARGRDADLLTDARAWTLGLRESADVRVGTAELEVLLLEPGR